MIDGIFRIEEMRAADCPDEFLTRVGNANVTVWRNRLADYHGPWSTKLCFTFPYISWCGDMYVDPDETMAVLVEETWEEAALEIEFDLMKKGLV
jgi:hypothetical protein